MKFVDQVDLRDKTVLIRADLNVPLGNNQEVTDDYRLQAAIPTINFIRECGGKVVLCSHLGSPKGVDNSLSLLPVARRLSELLKTEVQFSSACVGKSAEEKVSSLQVGEVLVLENLRFDSREKANDLEFARGLASLADVYVNDAFGTAHRAHASTAGVVQFAKVAVGGLLLKKEIDCFNRTLSEPKQPLVAIFGGVKASTKIPAILNVAKKSDKILVGGAMANTFLVAQGFDVGRSLIEPDQVSVAKEIISSLKINGKCKLILPVDFVVATELKARIKTEVVSPNNIAKDVMALDIGPQTVELFSKELADAKTIVWNGPLGAFETEGFERGTFGIIDTIANLTSAYRVVGGGDTDYALHKCHAFDKMSYVSTGGGAFLKMLEGAKLPAIEALESRV